MRCPCCNKDSETCGCELNRIITTDYAEVEKRLAAQFEIDPEPEKNIDKRKTLDPEVFRKLYGDNKDMIADQLLKELREMDE